MNVIFNDIATFYYITDLNYMYSYSYSMYGGRGRTWGYKNNSFQEVIIIHNKIRLCLQKLAAMQNRYHNLCLIIQVL